MDELLTVSDVANLCRVHVMTVRRQIASGALTSVRVGRGVRVRKKDLEAYLEPGEGAEQQPTVRHRKVQPRPFTMDDPIWDIVGMLDDPEIAWVSGDKRRALGEAYSPKP